MRTGSLIEPRLHHPPAGRTPACTSPVRVLHVLPSLCGGGMERAAVRLICGTTDASENADRPNHVLHGMCVLGSGDDDLLAQCRSCMPTWVLGVPGVLRRTGGRFSWWRLRRVMQRFHPNIVHARSTSVWLDAALAAWGRPRVRLLLSFHGRTHLLPPGPLRRQLNRWTIRRADAVLSVSREAADMMRRDWGAAEHKLHVIPNGVDTRQFRPADDPQGVRQTRLQLQLAQTDHVVLCVANLHPIKGLDVLLKSWRQVSMADRSARLVIVGHGPLRDSLERLTRELRCDSTVRFLGARRDVPALLRCGDLFVLPSRYEACSNAVLEAMAAGLPVVATDVGGMRELITPDHTGWLVPPDKPQPLARAILTALLDRPAREDVGRAARIAAVERFAIQPWVNRYASLYRELMRASRPQPACSAEDLACVE